jgi:sulfide:quinone oxidoreductase
MKKTVLILGAGTGGTTTAKELNKLVGNEDGIETLEIIVFEKEEKIIFPPYLLWLMIGKKNPDKALRSTKDLELIGIKVVIGEIENIDPENIVVTSNGKEYKGDFMVIAMGSEHSVEDNLKKIGHNFYSLEGTTNFYTQLKSFKGGNIAVVVPSLPYSSPAAPYEAVFHIEKFIRDNGLRTKTTISLFTPEKNPNTTAPKTSEAMIEMMKAKEISYFQEHELLEADNTHLTFKNGTVYPFDILAFTPQQNCPKVIANSELKGKTGWIDVDFNTLETNFKNVFAIGDITAIQINKENFLPKAGVFAQNQGLVVANIIANRLEGQEASKKFMGEGEYFIETGDDTAWYTRGNFYSDSENSLNTSKPKYFWHLSHEWTEKYKTYKYF